MAEALVQLRAICLSPEFDRYCQFHIHQDPCHLYPGSGPLFQSSHTQVEKSTVTKEAPEWVNSASPAARARQNAIAALSPHPQLLGPVLFIDLASVDGVPSPVKNLGEF